MEKTSINGYFSSGEPEMHLLGYGSKIGGDPIMATMTLVKPQYSYPQGAYNGQAKDENNKYLCSDKPVDIQKTYEEAVEADRKAAIFPFGDDQVKTLAKGESKQTDLLAAIYNELLQLNDKSAQTNKRLDRVEQRTPALLDVHA
jgi:hypothetical protein